MRTRLPLAAWSKRVHQAFFRWRAVPGSDLVRLVLLQTTYGDCHHHCHAAGDVQLHGSLAADEAVVEQEVASDACVDALQSVSPGMDLLPFASVARTQTEDAGDGFHR